MVVGDLGALAHLSFNGIIEVVLVIAHDVGHSSDTHGECVGLLVGAFAGAR